MEKVFQLKKNNFYLFIEFDLMENVHEVEGINIDEAILQNWFFLEILLLSLKGAEDPSQHPYKL